jgi:hypothetical protein
MSTSSHACQQKANQSRDPVPLSLLQMREGKIQRNFIGCIKKIGFEGTG